MKFEEVIKKVPKGPGIYIFKDKKNKVLYVGKAKNLRERLKSYLYTNSLKIKKLLEDSEYLEWLELGSESEAILKESELIKKFDPPFNHLLRDDTNFFYIVFTNEIFPKVLITHQPQKFSQAKFIFGPFLEGQSLKKTLALIRKFLPFCTCSEKHMRLCLNAEIGLCYGYCCKKDAKYTKNDVKNYNLNLKLVARILKGNFKELKKIILEEIKAYLRKDKLEEAEKLRQTYLAIKKLEEQSYLIHEKEKIEVQTELRKILFEFKNLLKLKKLPERIEAYDISHFSGKNMVGTMVAFISGEYVPFLKRKFKIRTVMKPDDPRMIYEVIKRRLKHSEWGIPDLILVDGGEVQRKFAEMGVKESGYNIKVISLAKPKEELILGPKKKISLSSLPVALRNFIKRLDLLAHKNVLKYHRQRRALELKR
jgi:excinuclease ABC subunit C